MLYETHSTFFQELRTKNSALPGFGIRNLFISMFFLFKRKYIERIDDLFVKGLAGAILDEDLSCFEGNTW